MPVAKGARTGPIAEETIRLKSTLGSKEEMESVRGWNSYVRKRTPELLSSVLSQRKREQRFL
jgi:hypothetical protein